MFLASIRTVSRPPKTGIFNTKLSEYEEIIAHLTFIGLYDYFTERLKL